MFLRKNYIGETERSLKLRINEHQRDEKNNFAKSAVAQHAKETGHLILYENSKILKKCENYWQKAYSESLLIQRNNPELNRDKGKVMFDNIFK